jgi:hypothetical protein
MSNFDLRKFLAEGKLHEEAASTEEVMDKPSTKMKMSELKKKIRQEILAELTLSEDSEVDLNISNPDEKYDFLDEATKDGDGEVPAKDADTDIDIVDKEEVEVEEKPKATGPSGDFLDQLEDLKDEADAMGDNKLERQVDNTITYFTRQHIAKDTNESIELEEDFGPAVQSTDPKAREIEDKLNKDGNLRNQIAQLMAQAEKGGNSSELLGKMTGLFEADKDYYNDAERDDAAHIAALEKDMEDDKRSAMKNESLKTKTTMKESLEILKMKKLAGLLTEGEYTKALLKEGDFTTFNNVMAILNQLLEMGDEGERVLAILERIPEWNELVRDNQDIDM